MAAHEDIAQAIGRVLWADVTASPICNDMSVEQLRAIFDQVGQAALNTARQQVAAVAQGMAATAGTDGEGVVAPLGSPDEEPAEVPEAPDVPE